ncbi:hypothetical protein F2Q69_00050443 [Brassica cretica]|uniref:Uncharacterized protein n=1 Tax=Brassica cretica TaxID=69181 RepID=A0A8S9PGC4_BRACR|nr:hypothetical protein F2Q69_00050443 [Brassica cretica]
MVFKGRAILGPNRTTRDRNMNCFYTASTFEVVHAIESEVRPSPFSPAYLLPMKLPFYTHLPSRLSQTLEVHSGPPTPLLATCVYWCSRKPWRACKGTDFPSLYRRRGGYFLTTIASLRPWAKYKRLGEWFGLMTDHNPIRISDGMQMAERAQPLADGAHPLASHAYERPRQGEERGEHRGGSEGSVRSLGISPCLVCLRQVHSLSKPWYESQGLVGFLAYRIGVETYSAVGSRPKAGSGTKDGSGQAKEL